MILLKKRKPKVIQKLVITFPFWTADEKSPTLKKQDEVESGGCGKKNQDFTKENDKIRAKFNLAPNEIQIQTAHSCDKC